MRITTSLALTASLLAAPALAQEEASEAPRGPQGCGAYPAHDDFDFWVGDWNVYGRDGRFAGQNFISRRSGGCLLLEEWFSAGGGDGTSMNYVDPATGDWRQIWMSANLYIDYSGGLNAAGQMQLDGEITYFNDEGSSSAAFRGVWTPLENGHVIQHFKQYDAEAETWNDWFIGSYVPIAEDPNGAEPGPDATGPAIEEAPAFAFE
ncbi:hypothetical protein E5163_14520 [Marinicauda algicola]|uniref:DUF1579 domain-containing protein n=1 Tax=Marinicauda algicola TaxID=2029849 RepID=A0A4S2GX81_9PROT|nr:hypothetical protein [Marinicauda algicola]TGY87644.1 hypothetical protein E5163_14520 [Marinicauda algicola]